MSFFQNLWKTFFQSELDQLVEKYTKFAVHSGEFTSKQKKESKQLNKTFKDVTVWVAQIREGVTPTYYRDLLFVFLTQVQFHIHKETSSVVEATHKIVKKRRCKFVLGYDEENGRILLANFTDEAKEPVSDFWKKLFMELGALLAKNGVLQNQTVLPLPEIKRPKDLTKDINDISDIFNVNASGSSELISRQVVWNSSRQLWKAFLRPDVREKSIKILFINFIGNRDFVIDGISTTKVKVSAHTGVLRLDCIMQFAPNQANENVLSIGYNDQVDFFEKGPFLTDLADVLFKYKLLREQTGRMEPFTLNDKSFEEQLNNPLDDNAFGTPEDLRLPPEVLSSSPSSAKFVELPDRHPAQEPAPEYKPSRKSLSEVPRTKNHNVTTESAPTQEPASNHLHEQTNGHQESNTNYREQAIPAKETPEPVKTQDAKEPATMKIRELSISDEDSVSDYSTAKHACETPKPDKEELKPVTHARPLAEKGKALTEDDLRKLVEREEQKWKLEEAKHQQVGSILRQLTWKEIEEQEQLKEAEEQKQHEQHMKNEIVQQKLQLELVDLIHQIERLVNRYGPLTETTVYEVSLHVLNEYKQLLLELQDKLDNKVTLLTFQPNSLSESQSVNMEQLALQTLSTIISQLAIIAQYKQEEEMCQAEQQVTEEAQSHQEEEPGTDIGQTEEIDLRSAEPEVFTNEEDVKQTV